MKRIEPGDLRLPAKADDPIKAIIRTYMEYRGIKSDYFRRNAWLRARYPYPRMAVRAKRLLEECGGKLEDAVWAVANGKYWL